MTENVRYKLGLQRIWYKSSGEKTGLNVVAKVFFPDGNSTMTLQFHEQGEGLYYRDIYFLEEGRYMAIFYENGEHKLYSSLDVVDKKKSSIVIPR